MPGICILPVGRRTSFSAARLAMRAIVVGEFGEPEQLRVAEIVTPLPSPGEVLIEIHAAPVNYVDLLVVGGTYQFLPARPFVPGKGPAGVVRAHGPGVS